MVLEADVPPLLKNLVLFARLLRRLGIPATPARLVDTVEAVTRVGWNQRVDVKNTVRATLVTRREQLELFDQAFDMFWRAPGKHPEIDLGERLQRVTRVNPRPEIQLAESSADSAGETSNEDERKHEVPAFSSVERLRHKDFAELTPEELALVDRMMGSLNWSFQQRRTRRRVSDSRGTFLDPRRTVRHNLRYGGEILMLKKKSRQWKQRDLVVICDISGSMELYSRILLQFVHLLTRGLQQTETFVFGTRLTRITHQLDTWNINQALQQAAATLQDWGGGTRIGEALKAFNYEWGRRVLSQGAVVLIISDGWDRGDIDLLGREMARLKRSCRRLVWLNPLLGSPRYQPLSRGIQAAQPHIDDFLPVHNLASLEQLGKFLAHIAHTDSIALRPARLTPGFRTDSLSQSRDRRRVSQKSFVSVSGGSEARRAD